MAQCVKAFAYMPDYPSLILGTKVTEKENELPQNLTLDLHQYDMAHVHTPIYTYTLTHKINTYIHT